MTRVHRYTLMPWTLMLVITLGVGLFAVSAQAGGRPDSSPGVTRSMQRFLDDREPVQNLAPMAFTPCVSGFAGPYPCNNVDLMAFMPLNTIGGGAGADIWGWTDPETSKEYALMARSSGISFVDISDPANPIYLGNLPTETFATSWRDVDVYVNHAFIVADVAGNHGMQVFDLTQLRNVINPPVTFSETAHYSGFNTAHTVAINPDTGFAYAAGSDTCSGGLHMVNIQNPTAPTFAGCYAADGYTHETQCVIYHGPDVQHRGKEICLASNEDTLTIVDVTNKSAPVQLSRTGYPRSGYTHQGWLSENHRYFVLDDELDEEIYGHNTLTRFFSIADLEAPTLRFIYTGPTRAIDHNLYVKGGFVYEGNYRSGLRIVKPPRTEVAYFDIYPTDDDASFNGAWGNYPFFDSGLVVVSGIEQGLFILRPNLPFATTNWMDD